MRNHPTLRLCLLALAVWASACTTAPTQTPVSVVMELPVTVEVTREVAVTELVTVVVTEIVVQVITATFTPTPRITLTPSNTPGPPTETPTPAPPTLTPDLSQSQTAEALAVLTEERGDGIYLVNVDIAPGVWRNSGTGDSCYWNRARRDGDLIDNHFGLAGGTIFIAASDFSVEFSRCGTWTYLGPP